MKKLSSVALLVAMSFIYSCQTEQPQNTSISKDDVKKHVSFLASDSLKGRKPGTKGGAEAAKYIATEFEKYGLQKMGNSYFQNFNVVSSVSLGEKNEMEGANFVFDVNKDFIPLAFSKNTKIIAEVVFAGYGIEFDGDSLKWNDYKNIDVKDKWVMMLSQDPDINNNNSPLIPISNERAKVLTAIDKGAAGVLFVSGVNTEKKDKLTKLYFDKSKSRTSIPVIQITRAAANKILSTSDLKIEDAEKNMIEKMKPITVDTKQTLFAEIDVNFIENSTQNVLAKIEGTDPKLKDEIIIIGAHYDHLGMGGPGSGSRFGDSLAVHNGADDNASGVAGVLELAQKFSDKKHAPKRSIIFMGFAAEEMGLLGSKYFSEHPLIDIKKVKMMINLDMIGRLDSAKTLIIGGTGTTAISEKILDEKSKNKGFNIKKSKEGSGPSDHSSFYVKNIPVLFFFTGIHDDYHTPADDIEKINFEGSVSVIKFGFDVAEEFANMPVAPKFVQVDTPSSRSNRRNLKVTFGIIPDYGGTSETPGLRVDGVKAGKPAQLGGMKKGDIITAVNGKKISNIYDYMARLGRLKPGERCNVDVSRNNKNIVLILEL